MQNAAVVSNLVNLVDHVQNSLRLVEQMIATETSPETSPASPGVPPISSCSTTSLPAT